MAEIRLGMLDILPTYGESAGAALTATIEQVQLAERLGFERYWLTEHQGWCGDSSPEMLLPLMAATTRRIKVGVAGILLNFHNPYKMARSFQLLEALFRGRVDLGICRGGVGPEAAAALRGPDAGPPSFAEFVDKTEALCRFLQPGGAPDGAAAPEQWLLGAGSATMELAARLGSSYCHTLTHLGCAADPAILARYHATRAPAARQHSAVLVGGICAATHSEALALRDQHRNDFLKPNIVGTPQACAEQLGAIAARFQVERVVWLDLSPARAALQRSITLIADAMALSG